MSFAYEPVFEPTPCWFENTFDTPVECGYLVVPEDRANPDSRMIRLAVAIMRHPDGNPEPDPIIHLAGGPGEKILHFMAEEYDNFARYFAINRDVIIFEQRGVGWSEPALDCPAFNEAMLDILDFEVDGRVVTAREAGEYIVEVLMGCAKTLSESAHLPAYNSRENAADVNDLRSALGYERVNLHAISYGTYLTLYVMRDFPSTIRSVVLDAAAPLDRPLDRFPANTAAKLDAFFAACAADEACQAAYPDLRQVYFDTLKRLDDNPVRLDAVSGVDGTPYTILLNSTTMAFAVSQLIRRTSRIPALPMIIYAASQGDFTFIKMFYGFFPLILAGLSAGMLFSVHGREKSPLGSTEAYESSVAKLSIGGDYWDFHPAGRVDLLVRERWGAGTAEKDEYLPVVSDIPTLILGGEFDPNAAPDDMSELAATLKNSYTYLMPWMGHAVSGNECANRMIREFFADPTKAPDSRCIEEWGTQFQFMVPGDGSR